MVHERLNNISTNSSLLLIQDRWRRVLRHRRMAAHLGKSLGVSSCPIFRGNEISDFAAAFG
jgi:hypothetical protein